MYVQVSTKLFGAIKMGGNIGVIDTLSIFSYVTIQKPSLELDHRWTHQWKKDRAGSSAGSLPD